MKAKRKITTTVYLTEEQNILLKTLSQRSKVPVAEYVRQGVDLILQKNAHLIPGQLSFSLNQKDKKNEKPGRNKK